MFDRNSDGKVHSYSFERIYAQFYTKGGHALTTFDRLNFNNNDYIEYNEWCVACTPVLRDLFKNPSYLAEVFNKVVARDSDTKFMDYARFPRRKPVFSDFKSFKTALLSSVSSSTDLNQI